MALNGNSTKTHNELSMLWIEAVILFACYIVGGRNIQDPISKNWNIE